MNRSSSSFFVSIKIISILFVIACFASVKVIAVDLPVFYKAPQFQGQPVSDNRDWKSYLDVQVTFGDTFITANNHGDTRSIFNEDGFADVGKLGLRVENITSKPKTNEFWGAGGKFEDGPDIPVKFCGHFDLDQAAVSLRQNLLKGFFFEAYVPFRRITIDQIKYLNKSDDVVNGVNIDDFVSNDLSEILEEFCIKPFCSKFKRTCPGDGVFYAGWQGCACDNIGVVDWITGMMRFGIVAPLSGKRDDMYVFSVPCGYDRHWGFSGRINVEVSMLEKLRLGVGVGSLIFLNDTRLMRVHTHEDQNGWMALEKARVKKKQGNIWDAYLYLKAHRIFKGFSILGSVSFTKQERTFLTVRDSKFLKTFIEASKTRVLLGSTSEKGCVPDCGGRDIRLISSTYIVNTNKRLESWEQVGLHGRIEYDFAVHSSCDVGPKIAFVYDHAVAGKRTWLAHMLGGLIGVQFNLPF